MFVGYHTDDVPPGAFGPRVVALIALLHGRYRISNCEIEEQRYCWQRAIEENEDDYNARAALMALGNGPMRAPRAIAIDIVFPLQISELHTCATSRDHARSQGC
jgi:hypothetical protein